MDKKLVIQSAKSVFLSKYVATVYSIILSTKSLRVFKSKHKAYLAFSGLILLLRFMKPQQDIEDKIITPPMDGKDDHEHLKSNTRRSNAVIVVLARNHELSKLRITLREFEDRFNSKFHYPYVFLNNKPHSKGFRQTLTKQLMLDAKNSTRSVSFGVVPTAHWSYPEWIDQRKVAEARANMPKHVHQGHSEPYHHMCRYFSGFFFDHPLLAKYDYYWRVEPAVRFFCDIDYDPFLFMEEHGKVYGFNIMLYEQPATIPTLWNTTLDFMSEVYPLFKQTRMKPPQSPAAKCVLRADTKTIRDKYISQLMNSEINRDGSNDTLSIFDSVRWDTCHYWSNFEIANLNFFRSPLYKAYFDFLDKSGGFYYERWGDAPVHTLAVSLFLETDQVHYFKDIGYQHTSVPHCPADGVEWGKCSCKSWNKAYRFGKPQCIDGFLKGLEI